MLSFTSIWEKRYQVYPLFIVIIFLITIIGCSKYQIYGRAKVNDIVYLNTRKRHLTRYIAPPTIYLSTVYHYLSFNVNLYQESQLEEEDGRACKLRFYVRTRGRDLVPGRTYYFDLPKVDVPIKYQTLLDLYTKPDSILSSREVDGVAIFSFFRPQQISPTYLKGKMTLTDVDLEKSLCKGTYHLSGCDTTNSSHNPLTIYGQFKADIEVYNDK